MRTVAGMLIFSSKEDESRSIESKSEAIAPSAATAWSALLTSSVPTGAVVDAPGSCSCSGGMYRLQNWQNV